MFQIWPKISQLVCSGWRVMSHASTANWVITTLPNGIVSGALAIWAWFKDQPGPIIAVIFIVTFAAIFICTLAYFGYREPKPEIIQGSPSYVVPAIVFCIVIAFVYLLGGSGNLVVPPRNNIAKSDGNPANRADSAPHIPSDRTIKFDYSTNNGKIAVFDGKNNFVLRFSKASNTSIYLYKDGTNLTRIVRVV
jgi:hypothetical protein